MDKVLPDLKSLRIACVIPARLESSRFPRKILKPLGGQPLLKWAFDGAKQIPFFDDVIIAVDAQETADVVSRFDGPCLMTSKDCLCGTDRLIEVMKRCEKEYDVWVNWQADEPFLTQKLISQLLSSCGKYDADVWTLKKRIKNEEDIHNPNVAKVVCDVNGYALYFSRGAIPFYRSDFVGEKIFHKHIGLFAFTTNALQKISTLKMSNLESAEKLEQLRFLQNRLKIRLHETDEEVVGIDTPQDLVRAEQFRESRKL